MESPDIILYQHNYYKPLLDKAFKITEQYVSDNKLILTGGMAIDKALREKGHSIYDDDELPDFDIISDKNLFHANTLAQILCDKGLPDINVINAVHITTLRVRIKNMVLLDLTFIPTECIKKIPYLDVEHLRIVHPYYQFIDQRLSLSTLMIDTGISLNIFNRLVKDMNRNLLLRALYPIPSTNTKVNLHTVRIPLDLIAINEDKLKYVDEESNTIIYTGKTCIAGYLAYILMLRQNDNSVVSINVTDSLLEIEIPEDEYIRLLVYNISEVKDYIKKPITYNLLLNLKPICQQSGIFEFVDSYGLLIGCNIIELSNDVKVCVASTDYILMEMLRDRIYVSEEPYSTWYNNLVSIVDSKREQSLSDQIWWPSINTYGIMNLAEYKIFALQKIMNPDDAALLRPRNSYPSAPKCLTRNNFNVDDSHFFQIDGKKNKKLVHTNYRYIMSEFDNYIETQKKKNKVSSKVVRN